MSEKKEHELLRAWQAEREVMERNNDLMNILQHE